jgi:hypothetical protein
LLRGAGVALSLPLLDAMVPSVARSATGAEAPASSPKRLLAICNNLGVLPDQFFPATTGKQYELSPYLGALAEFRDRFTVVSGVSHPGVDGSHASDVSFLTAAPHPGSGGFRNTISLDQVVAAHYGNQTRFSSLTLGVNAKPGRRSLSWTAGGFLIPCEDSAAAVYRRLFLQGTPAEVEGQIRKLKLGQSIMDTLAAQARSLHRRLGPHDRQRMEQFSVAVRDVERQMLQAQAWERKARPTTKVPMPHDPPDSSDYLEKTRLMYQMARLAFETDATRAVTLLLDSNNSPAIKVEGTDISDGYHNLSHHGRNPQKLQQLAAIDQAHMRLLGELFGGLDGVADGPGTLLDQTMVLYGSNFGDANKHTTDNLPILLAGGGFRHGAHLAFDRDRNYPLPRLFVSMLQQAGVATDQFATANGTMAGLEPTG